MKVMFIHDNKFYKCGNEVYSLGAFSHNILWERYLSYFNEIIVGARVIKSNDKQIMEKMYISSGEKVSFLPLPDIMSLNGLKHVKECYKTICENLNNVDCAIIRLPSALGLVAIEACKAMGKPWISEVVGCVFDSFWSYGSLIGKLMAVPMYILTKRAIRQSEDTIYVSQRFLQNRYPNKKNNIGCSDVNINSVPDDILIKRLEKIRNMKAESKVKIGLIGPLGFKTKGHDIAIKAISLLDNKLIKLHLLGGGDQTKVSTLSKEYKIDQNVIYEGTLPAGDPVMKWIDNIDILIMPSRTEGLPRALVEAMSRGCICVASNVGGIRELLPCEVRHKNYDYVKLAKIIEDILEGNISAEQCARVNFEEAKKYNINILNERRSDFYIHFIEKNTSNPNR